ncbi:MAG TPA: restriction endonuclease subunit S, partial [Bacteroidales bacterium]|nr:restriction endonuclease subunit S [Bacteroidales bacterium]
MKLGEVCILNPRRGIIERNDNTITTFIPMESVDAITGTISSPQEKKYQDVKKGYTFFQEKDVLFAKITPCMQNGKHAIAENLIDSIGFGSTEFHVLRPGDVVLPELLWYFLRQPSLLKKATEHFTGAVGQQRLPEDYLKSLDLPLPPLNEQKRIAAILKEQLAAVDKARKAAEERLEAIKALPAAFLREAFPQPGQPLPEGWRWVKLGEIIHLHSGEFLPSTKMDQIGGFPVYGGNGITGYHNSYMFEGQKIIIGRVGALCGCVHLSESKSWITDNALYVDIKKLPVEDEYLFFLLTRLNLRQYANQMGQPVIASSSIYELTCPFPILLEQQRIA